MLGTGKLRKQSSLISRDKKSHTIINKKKIKLFLLFFSIWEIIFQSRIYYNTKLNRYTSKNISLWVSLSLLFLQLLAVCHSLSSIDVLLLPVINSSKSLSSSSLFPSWYFHCLSHNVCSFEMKCLLIFFIPTVILNIDGGCPRGVMVKAMDCGIVKSELVLQSR